MESGPPSKQYLKIGEVSRLAGLNSSVLRFWETEFETLRPQKGRTGQRHYSKADVEQVLLIKRLLYDEKLTIAGARSRLSKTARKVRQDVESEAEIKKQLLEEVRRDLLDFRNSL